jgi:hypothetical protein
LWQAISPYLVIFLYYLRGGGILNAGKPWEGRLAAIAKPTASSLMATEGE